MINKIKPNLLKNLIGKKNINKIVPTIEKVIITKNLGQENLKSKRVYTTIEDIKRITGQLPVIIYSKKTKTNLKQQYIGLKVTLRKEKMYIFINKLIHFVLTRSYGFKGYSLNSFDKQGNFNIKINNYFWFPEMETIFPKLSEDLNINIVFKNILKNKEGAILVLKALYMPFK